MCTSERHLSKAWSQVMRPRGISSMVPDSKQGSDEAWQRRLWQIFSSSSGHRRVGPALDEVLAELLSKQEKACAYGTHADTGFRDFCWELLSWQVEGAQGHTWLHHLTSAYCTPSWWGPNGYTTSSALIMVANVLLIGIWSLEPTSTVFQNTPVCAVNKNYI